MSSDRIVLPEPLQSLIGGIEKSAITNFYGAPGAGKTNLCLLASLECIRNNGKVVFVDTEGGFSVERLKQLTENFEHVLRKVTLIQVKDFKDQNRVIRSLKNTDTDMIVVDSLVALYRLECADPKKETLEANRELSIQLSILSNIAREKNIPVIVTTHTYKNWESGEDHIIGGLTTKYWSKSIILLEKTGKMSERRAVVIKHRSIPEGKSVKFLIVRNGIKPSGFKLF